MKGKAKMSKEKELFVSFVENALKNLNGEGDNIDFTDEEVLVINDYFNKLKNGGEDKSRPAFTEKGAIILNYLKDNPDAVLPAKKIAEDLELSSRTVSGAMKKLVTDGYVEKFEGEPKTYSITEKGKEVQIEV